MKILSKIKTDLEFKYQNKFASHTNEKFLNEKYYEAGKKNSFCVTFPHVNATLSAGSKKSRRRKINNFKMKSLYKAHDREVKFYNQALILQTIHPDNYGHCLHDVIPTIIYHEKHSNANIIITAGSEILDSLIEILGIKLKKTTFIYNKRPGYTACFQAHSICIYNQAKKNTNYCRHIKKTILFKTHIDKYINNHTKTKIKNRLIYCSRNHSKNVRHGRRMNVENENTIINLLKEYCNKNAFIFTFFTGEINKKTAPHLDQLETFREAGIVVGPHGSAMANIIYCNPKNGVKVCEFTSGTDAVIHGGIFGKNYDNLNAGHLAKIYDYNLIPFAKQSTKKTTSIDANNLKTFLAS